MAIPNTQTTTFAGRPEFTVEGLLRVTVRVDGSALIDFAGKHVEVELNMSVNQIVVRRENLAVYGMKPVSGGRIVAREKASPTQL
jgi:hypothetical protein